MKFFNTFDTAASGMRAEQFRMDLISENIANAHTAKTADGTPYRRKMAIATAEQKAQFDSEFSSASFDASGEFDTKSGTASYQGGGVSVASANDNSDYNWVYDPTNPNACQDGDHKGYVAMPNVNIISEMTSMMQATRSYEANATIVESAKAMAMKALEIGRG
ncbi:flagellar basal body rod protein FlgC [bacterium]|nr:flagellar basal body rod protein FlgC [bacterium]